MYPAGSKQGRVKLPAVVLMVDADELLQSEETAQQVTQAVGAGATAVVLTGGNASGGAAAAHPHGRRFGAGHAPCAP